MKNGRAQELVDNFVYALQQHLSITPMKVDFSKILNPFFPNGSFPAFQLSSNKLAEYRSWLDVGKPTSDQYFTQFGRQPIFDPIPEKMFARAQFLVRVSVSTVGGGMSSTRWRFLDFAVALRVVGGFCARHCM